MLTSFLVHAVDFCRRFALVVSACLIAIGGALGAYAIEHLKINTDIDQLMASDLEWRQKEREIDAAFPQRLDRLVIVVDGLNADLAEEAAASLATALGKRSDLFKTVTRPDSFPYFQKYGLLFLDEEALADVLDTMAQAQPMMGALARDPSLRGLFHIMEMAVEGIKRGQTSYQDLAPSFALMAETIAANLHGENARLPWRSMMSSKKTGLRETRKFVLAQPILDFSSLTPGGKASAAVRDEASKLGLTTETGVTVRLTGSVALNDEEFASVAEGTKTATAVSGVLVLILLFLALRSWRLILPIVLTLVIGLAATTAFAMAVIGSLNLISVAFAVMFVGIAVDFGIQFGVRLRDEKHKDADTARAMAKTAGTVAAPLAMAAASTIIGFLAFLPTNYRGVSELGLIASVGMSIAFMLNVTLLPALLALARPPAEPEAIGYAWAAPVDRFLSARRRFLLPVIAALAFLSLFGTMATRFDFDPLNLKDPHAPSVATLLDVIKDPDANPYAIQILVPSLEEAETMARAIEALPEVDHTITRARFVPKDQAAKLAQIADAKFILDPSLHPEGVLIPPSEYENLSAMREAVRALRSLGEDKAEAQRLAEVLDQTVARNSVSLLERLRTNMIDGMTAHLNRVRDLLSGEKAAMESIDSSLRRDWITPDGRTRMEVYPKGNARDPAVLAAFTNAVRKIAPEASGTPISIQESGKTVMNAFIKAGALGVLSIAGLCWIVLRSIKDVLRLIAPLILAGMLTLGTMAVFHLPLNFANVIGLPLPLSLGVSYAIYFITYWRNGGETPLSSSMARAVLFSAGTTLVAFGSLSLSSHAGTRSMGELLTIALLYSLLCTYLVLPVLLVPLRSAKEV